MVVELFRCVCPLNISDAERTGMKLDPAGPVAPLIPEVPEEPFAPLIPEVPLVPDEPFAPLIPEVPDVDVMLADSPYIRFST